LRRLAFDHDVTVPKTTYLTALVKGRTDRVSKGFSDEWGQRGLGGRRRRLCWIPLVRRLFANGYAALCVDFLWGSKANISNLLAHLRFEPLRLDVTFLRSLEAGEICGPACPASPIH
jgi:hypothetical protein